MLGWNGIPSVTEQVRVHLERLLMSSEFSRSVRMAEFLRFVVSHKFAADGDPLKERTVGIEVFGRALDWDPKQDTIVRTEARRLRAKLETYYENAGRYEPIRILVPKGGYSAEIKVLDCPERRVTENFPTFRLGWLKMALALGVLFTLVGLTWHQFHHATVGAALPARPGQDDFEIVPFSTEVGRQFSPSISPDSSKIAFVWNGAGSNYDIYVKSVNDGVTQRITSNPAPEHHPTWSPDGRKVAFLRSSANSIEVMLKDIESESERKIGSVAAMPEGWASDNPFSGCQSPAWSRDAKNMVLTEASGNTKGHGLVFLSLVSGAKTAITSPPGEDQDCYPRFSPDGSRLAFVRYISHGEAELYIVAPDGSGLKRLTTDSKNIRGLDWSPDGRQIVFASNRGGSYEIRTIGPEGGESKPLPSNTGSASEPAVARNGKFMAYVESTDNWNIWRARIEAGPDGEQHLKDNERFLASSGQNHSPSFSPDGSTIAFVSNRSGAPEIWFTNAGGQNPKQMTHFGGPWLGTIRWSPDGKQIVFDARPRGHSGIFTMPSAGGPPTTFQQDQFENRRPAWSRDGKSIYFDSTRSGRPQIFKRSLETGIDVPVAPPDTLLSVESLNGTDLFFTRHTHELWKSRSDGRDAVRIAGIDLQPELDWTVSDDAIFFASCSRTSSKFYSYCFRDLTIKQIGESAQSLSPGTPSLVVSPDGKQLLYAATDYTKSDIKIRRLVTPR